MILKDIKMRFGSSLSMDMDTEHLILFYHSELSFFTHKIRIKTESQAKRRTTKKKNFFVLGTLEKKVNKRFKHL